ncbi:MAG: hypothetical protein KC457_12750 [Myxococcales bacterium]|nr:hypothetical protein [Myxococcales bacterium]
MDAAQNFRARLTRIQHWLIPTDPEHSPSSGRRLWLLSIYTIRRWLFTDRCSSLASGLTLQTLLSVVPTVGVILFFISKLDPSFGSVFVTQIAFALSPEMDRAGELAKALVDLASGVKLEELGAGACWS